MKEEMEGPAVSIDNKASRIDDHMYMRVSFLVFLMRCGLCRDLSLLVNYLSRAIFIVTVNDCIRMQCLLIRV